MQIDPGHPESDGALRGFDCSPGGNCSASSSAARPWSPAL